MEKISNPYKKCPRCKNKVQDYQKKCDECGLIFSRLDKAQNKFARKELLGGHKENVVYVKKLPSDVSRWKLILLCGFLGVFGAHCFYVGRYPRGFYMLIVGLISIVMSVLPFTEIYEKFISFFFILPGLLAYMWIFDIVRIGFGTFKIPVALERKE